MSRNDVTKTVFFETLIWNQRKEVLAWMRVKHSNLSYADAEDIYQEATCALWQKMCSMTDWHGEPMVGMLKAICRNICNHWLRSHVVSADWDDRYAPTDYGVETDNGYVSSDIARLLLKERMYEMIERLPPTDRSLMEMHLQNVRMDKIAQRLGFRNAQVARNRKYKILVKLCKDINAQAAKACASFLDMITNFRLYDEQKILSVRQKWLTHQLHNVQAHR